MCEERTKVCTRCEIEKPLTEYRKKKSGKYGFASCCRECSKELNKKYREANKEKIKAKDKKWREENPEYHKKWREENPEYHKKWREENPEYHKKWYERDPKKEIARVKKWREENPEYQKKYYQENKEQIRARYKRYYQENLKEQRGRARKRYHKNKKELDEKSKKWRQDNPEWCKAYQKKWFENNREKARLYAHKRRALLAEATVEDFTEQELFDFWKENGINDKECHYCKKEMPEKPETWDHYIAISNGGSHERANLLPCCKSCNSRKHTKDPEVFMEELKNGV